MQAFQIGFAGVQCCGEGGFGSTSHRKAMHLLTAAFKADMVSSPPSSRPV